MLMLCPSPFVPIVMLYINVYVIDKQWCEHEPNQTADYAVNPELIMSQTPLTNGCIRLVAYTSSSKLQAVLIMTAIDFSSMCCSLIILQFGISVSGLFLLFLL